MGKKHVDGIGSYRVRTISTDYGMDRGRRVFSPCISYFRHHFTFEELNGLYDTFNRAAARAEEEGDAKKLESFKGLLLSISYAIQYKTRKQQSLAEAEHKQPVVDMISQAQCDRLLAGK